MDVDVPHIPAQDPDLMTYFKWWVLPILKKLYHDYIQIDVIYRWTMEETWNGLTDFLFDADVVSLYPFCMAKFCSLLYAPTPGSFLANFTNVLWLGLSVRDLDKSATSHFFRAEGLCFPMRRFGKYSYLGFFVEASSSSKRCGIEKLEFDANKCM